MIPATFEYKKANSIEEALSMVSEDAKILGGGQSLIPAMKLRLNSPEQLIDISKIDSLKAIDNNSDDIVIGAGSTHAAIMHNDAIATACPMMRHAASEIGDIQVRNKGTIGGSIAHADPAADWPAVLIAADAEVHIQNTSGKRSVGIDQFFTGFYETALEDGEVITGISIPKSSANASSVYVKFKQPASRFAIVGVAVSADVSDGSINNIRIGVTGLADAAYRAEATESALTGNTLTAASIESAVENIGSGVSIMSDHYASEKYRLHLAKVMATRALSKFL